MRTCITRLSRYLWHRDKATPTSSHFVRICLNCEMDIVRIGRTEIGRAISPSLKKKN